MRALFAATLLWGCNASDSGPPEITRPMQTSTSWSTGSDVVTPTTTSPTTNPTTNPTTDSGVRDSATEPTTTSTSTSTSTTNPDDRDGDGVLNDDDCEPDNPVAYPGALEFCDGVDNDCDGIVDYGQRALRIEPGDSLRSDIPLSELSTGNEPLVVEFWIRVVSNGGDAIEWMGTTGGFKAMFENDLYPVMSLINEGGVDFTGAMRDSVLSDTWTHVLLMLELTKDDEVALYLNGVPNSYERIPSTFMNGGGITGENYLWFGGESATSDIYIDEVRIWNQEAVRTDILDRMCVPLNGDEEGLIGYWPMEDDYNAVIPATGTMSVFSGSPEFVDL